MLLQLTNLPSKDSVDPSFYFQQLLLNIIVVGMMPSQQL